LPVLGAGLLRARAVDVAEMKKRVGWVSRAAA
jgi:hypothetical protein